VASGDIIVHWDDDDWYAPWRVRYQIQSLRSGGFQVCGLNRAIYVSVDGEHAWEYVHPPELPPWVVGATLCYWKSFWGRNPFPDVTVGEDWRFVQSARDTGIALLTNNGFFVGRIHNGNTCRKRPIGARWKPYSIKNVRSLVGGDWEEFISCSKEMVTSR
jgi:hypothetical protein